MRGGGPKLFCSPYFSIGASLVLVIMTIKYYSLSSSYDDLLLKVSVFQNQLKLTASNMRNLDASLTRKEDALNECIDEKKTVQERNKNLDQDLDKKLADLVNLQGANDDANNLVRKLKDNIDKCSHDNSTMLEELKYLRRRNEELSYNDKECQANKAKINQLEGELNTLKDQSSALHAQNIKLKQDSEAARNQPPGQLPDLDPGKVSIIQPALNGPIFQRIEQMNWKILELSERTRNDHELIANLIFTFNKISLKFNTVSPSKLEGMIKIIEESVGSRLRDLKELQMLTDKAHLQEKWPIGNQEKSILLNNIPELGILTLKIPGKITTPLSSTPNGNPQKYTLTVKTSEKSTIPSGNLPNANEEKGTLHLKIPEKSTMPLSTSLKGRIMKRPVRSILLKHVLGIIGHKEPILPRGDPNAERPQPQLHLDAPLHDDNAIREEIIKEEEAKENAIEDVIESESETLEDETPAPLIEPNQINADLEKAPEIHDLAEFPVEDQDKPKPMAPIPHESFLAKKAKYDGKRPATETFLDLKLLKRNNLGVPGSNPDYKSLDEDEEEDEQETEKAVLKLPPSLGDILSKKQNGSIDDAQEIRNNKLPVLDDQIKDYEEDFPNDKEKRDPALILQDPLARDQDDDARISDAIQNDFERKQHNWRNKLMP